MKKHLFFLFAAFTIAYACTNPPAEKAAEPAAAAEPAPVGKGILSITSAPELTFADYDKVAAELTASGEWMKTWTYHAIGAMQPKGFFSIGVYPNQEAFDHRRGALKAAFTKFNINAPAPQIHEVHNIVVGTQPASKPAGAFIAAFAQANMTPATYADILKELEAKGQGAPSGRIYHVSYVTEAGVQVIDVWESEAQFKAFGDVLMPILATKGVTAQPTMYPLYNLLNVK